MSHTTQINDVTWHVESPGSLVDVTAELQDALDDAAPVGGVVLLDPGVYACQGRLTVPPAVTLRSGSFPGGPPRGRYTRVPVGGIAPGAELWTTVGQGSPNADPFLTLRQSATLAGITIVYPDQTATNPPLTYPYAVAFANGEASAALVDCLLLNPYQGVRVLGHEKPLIRGLSGQPLFVGIALDEVYDVARLGSVHFWPGFWLEYDAGGPIETYMRANATALSVQRVDEIQCSDFFAYGYLHGHLLWAGAQGAGFGSFSNTLLDCCVSAITVLGGQPPGYSYANLRVIGATQGVDHRALSVQAGTGFSVQVSNGMFQSAGSTALVEIGSGANAVDVALHNCLFQDWEPGGNSAAVQLASTSATLRALGATFIRTTGYQLDVSTLTNAASNSKAIIGSRLVGGKRFKFHPTTPTLVHESGNYV